MPRTRGAHALVRVLVLFVLLVACSSDAKDVMGGGHDSAGGAGGASTIGTSGNASGGADAGRTPAMAGSGGAAVPSVGGASGRAASGGSGQGLASGGVSGGSGGANATGGSANTTGGSSATGGAAATGGGGSGGAGSTEFALMPVGATTLQSGEFAFPAAAIPPTNQSPEFTWQGVPSAAKSLALVFRDLSGGAVKWVLWDIPPAVNHLPASIGNAPNPSQVPGSSQLGSLGNQGYAGPCCTDHTYEFVLWALDVEKLPGTAGQSTKTIRDTLLDMHDVGSTGPVLMRIMP